MLVELFRVNPTNVAGLECFLSKHVNFALHEQNVDELVPFLLIGDVNGSLNSTVHIFVL